MSVPYLIVSAALSGLLIWCAVNDIRCRRIPNQAVLAVLALYAVAAVAGVTDSVVSGLLAGLVALAVCFGLFAFKVIGAGDAKLFAAVAPFGGLMLLPTYAVATVLAGGAIVLAMLAFNPGRAFVLIVTKGQLGTSDSVPYGVAIAIGGLVIQWGPALGLFPR